MFSELSTHTFSKYLTDSYMEGTKDKRSRILYMGKYSKLNDMIEKAYTRVHKCSYKNGKSTELSDNYYCTAMLLYSSDANSSQIRNVVKKASKAIINAPFGSKTFVDAYTLRAKCHLRLSEYENALYDVNISIEYDQIDSTRLLIKAIALFNLNDFIQLKDLLVEFKDITVDTELQAEFDQSGFSHLSLEYLHNFVSDPNFAFKTSRSAEEKCENDFSFMKPLIDFEKNYQLDPRCKILNDSYKGRHFKALDDIPRGSKILLERSFSLVLDNKLQHEYCICCYKRCHNYIPCKYCTDAVFCNEDCFQMAWTLFHQYECTLLTAFNDSFNASLHMYRTISRVGMWNAIDVHKKFKDLQSDPKIIKKAREENKTIRSAVNDVIIESYLDDEDISKTVECKQTESQRTKVFEMLYTLLDHNEKYELYYDVCYMIVAIDVAILLLMNEYLRDKINDDSQLRWSQLDLKKCNSMTKENKSKTIENYKIFGYSMDTFINIVEIILFNIRKLGTNVFSWNLYDSNYSVKRNIGTCECLVGSFINHSCDPNVEWDFKNGCIIYTALRDIKAGEEINNSYGPYTSTPFIERQTLLANSYYFNCYCSACQNQVNDYMHVLQCKSCAGPVVIIPEATVSSTCMSCHKTYSDSRYRMKRVNESRVTFKRLLHYFNQPSLYLTDKENNEKLLRSNLKELLENMDYQITYMHVYNKSLQYNLNTFCQIMEQLGKVDLACNYGQFQMSENSPEFQCVSLSEVANESGSENTKTMEEHVENLKCSTFWCNLYQTYLSKSDNGRRFKQSPSSKIIDFESLTGTAKQFVTFFKRIIRLELQMLQQKYLEEENKHKSSPTSEEDNFEITVSGNEDNNSGNNNNDALEAKSDKQEYFAKELFTDIGNHFEEKKNYQDLK